MTMQSDATNLATHPRKARALELMLQGNTDRQVAADLGVDPSTVWRWRTDPGFAAELEAERRDRFALLEERLTGLVQPAVDTLASLLSEDTPPMLRLRAAEAILDRTGWAGQGQDRRVKAEIEGHMGMLLRMLADRIDGSTFDRIIEALRQPPPEPEPGAPHKPRTRVIVELTTHDQKERHP